MDAYRVWEAERQSREERCQRYEEERDGKELLREDEADENMANDNQQFMLHELKIKIYRKGGITLTSLNLMIQPWRLSYAS